MKLTIPLIITIILLASACTFQPEENPEYRQGKEGLIISIINLQDAYLEGDYLDLEVLLENKGAHDYPFGKIVFSGYDKNSIKITETPVGIPEIQGKDPFLYTGGSEIVKVPEFAPLSIQLGESYTPSLQTSVCYNYETIANPVVCIIDDYSDYTQREICEPLDQSYSSQGGPVALTHIREQIIRNEVSIIATIKNLGDGRVYKPGDIQAFEHCPYGFTTEDIDQVKVTMAITGLGTPECTPSDGMVKLVDDQGTIKCNFVLQEDSAYETPLFMLMEYGYTSTISDSFTIYSAPDNIQTAFDMDSYSGYYSDTTQETGPYPTNYDCPCSQANIDKWNGCICVYIDGQMYVCGAGTNVYTLNKAPGEIVNYQIHGYEANRCGRSSSPTDACPFSGAFTMPSTMKTLNIYGMSTKNTPISEVCKFIPSST